MKLKVDGIRIIGLTGGIGSGKSTVGAMLAKKGFLVLDADQISRTLTAPGGKAHKTLQSEFGTADRAQLRQLVFSDPIQRKRLEGILHPLIRSETLDIIKSRAKKGDTVIYEATLLIETNTHLDLDGLICVGCPEEIRVQRICESRGLTPEDAKAILKSQSTDAARRPFATHWVDNSGNQDQLREKIDDLVPCLNLAST